MTDLAGKAASPTAESRPSPTDIRLLGTVNILSGPGSEGGGTFNIAYSHVLCHAEVKRRTRQMRLFAALYLYALAVAVIVLWVR